MPIFFGVEGSMFFLFSHENTPITGNVSATIKSGLNDWNISGDIEFIALALVIKRNEMIKAIMNRIPPIILPIRLTFFLMRMKRPAIEPITARIEGRVKKR
jgi:hypothetical protein